MPEEFGLANELALISDLVGGSQLWRSVADTLKAGTVLPHTAKW